MSHARNSIKDFTKPMRAAFKKFNRNDPKAPENRDFNDLVNELQNQNLYTEYLRYVGSSTYPDYEAIYDYLSPAELKKTEPEIIVSVLHKEAYDTDKVKRLLNPNHYLNYSHFSMFKTQLKNAIQCYADEKEMTRRGLPASSAPTIYNEMAIEKNAALLNQFMKKLDDEIIPTISASILGVIGVTVLTDLVIEYICITDEFLNFLDDKSLKTSPRR